ncbi:MAG: TRAP transporter large permease subunit [Ruminococcaceae bacterium]|nr:TRAP transporter large permease subunit [Oscillospiraceae bacterium]
MVIPSALIYLGIMLGVIVVWFMLLKRPVYEAVLISFVVLLTVTGNWGNVGAYIDKGLSTSLLYSMTAFVAMSIILTKTKIIDSCLAIILSLLGRIPGGAGYVSVIASSFMGALSGSGPGNVMATGAITIPAMKRTGFPPELAANIESNASYMGNMIPPSSNILAALSALTALYGDEFISQGQFWIVLWGIGLWFILQRLITVFAFCKYYKVKAMAKEELPSFKESLKVGWQGLLLPVIILLPFVLDYLFKDSFFTDRLGATGAKYMSSSILLFIPGVAALFSCLITKEKKTVTPHGIAKMFGNGVKSISPAVGVCVFGYMIGALFSDLNVAADLEAFIAGASFGKFGLVVFLCILTCFLGMVIPGSSLVVIFGPVFITTFASVGVDPILAAAMLPCICGVMCGITPPLGLGMYAGMSLAESDFSKTFKNNLWWVAGQFIMEVVVLMGWLPILGL